MKIIATKSTPFVSKHTPAELIAKRDKLQEVGNVGEKLREALANAGK